MAVEALSGEDFSAAVAAITSAFGDPTRRKIYLSAHEHDEGLTASEVAARFQLHANVARHHLDKLAAGGYLEVHAGHRGGGGAGRPSKRYLATGKEMALEFPVRHDDLVITLLARALELLPRDVAEAMAEEVGISYGRAMGASLSPGSDGHLRRRPGHGQGDARGHLRRHRPRDHLVEGPGRHHLHHRCPLVTS